MDDYDNPPIPMLITVDGWKDIKIIDCGEKLVPLEGLNHSGIEVEPQYFLQHQKGALKGCFARIGVVEKLLQAAKKLPNGFKLVILDAWRPLVVQQNLFEDFRSKLKEANPDWNDVTLDRETQRYVSLPSPDMHKPSPHLTGGAIDLTIKKESDSFLNMGTAFDDFTERSYTRYYERKIESGNRLSHDEGNYVRNRRMLYYLMINVGFTNYSEEWWHFDYGDQFWGKITGKPAIYGRGELSNN